LAAAKLRRDKSIAFGASQVVKEELQEDKSSFLKYY
jgi:hypothetical protein